MTQHLSLVAILRLGITVSRFAAMWEASHDPVWLNSAEQLPTLLSLTRPDSASVSLPSRAAQAPTLEIS
jgi:hypothetical protein